MRDQTGSEITRIPCVPHFANELAELSVFKLLVIVKHIFKDVGWLHFARRLGSCCFITPRQSLLAFSAHVADVGLAQNNNNKNVWTTIAIVIYRPSEESQQRCLGALVFLPFLPF